MNINCFGKLPLYADFLKFNALSSEFGSLDKWFQQGIYMAKSKWGNGFQEYYKKLSPCKFVFQPENFSNAITGTFIPGEDKGGRKFPFIIFSANRQMNLNDTAEYCFKTDKTFFSQAVLFSKKDRSGVDSEMFMSEFGQWTTTIVDIDNHNHGHCLNLKSNFDFWKDILGDYRDKRKYLIIQNIIDTLLPIKTYGLSRSFPCLKFPLSSNQKDSTCEVVFWLNLIHKIVGKNFIIPSILWNQDDSGIDNFLYVYFREPFPKEFLYLLRPGLVEDDSPCDMLNMRAAKLDETINKMGSHIISLLDRKDINMAEVLQQVSA